MSTNHKFKNAEFTIFFVLNGLVDGEEGYYATRTNEDVLEDGWYYLYGDDPGGNGPYISRDEAIFFCEKEIDADIEYVAVEKLQEIFNELYNRGYRPEDVAGFIKKALSC